jgi:hypothetical protein
MAGNPELTSRQPVTAVIDGATSRRAAASDAPDDVKGVTGGRPRDGFDGKQENAADDGSLNRPPSGAGIRRHGADRGRHPGPDPRPERGRLQHGSLLLDARAYQEFGVDRAVKNAPVLGNGGCRGTPAFIPHWPRKGQPLTPEQ